MKAPDENGIFGTAGALPQQVGSGVHLGASSPARSRDELWGVQGVCLCPGCPVWARRTPCRRRQGAQEERGAGGWGRRGRERATPRSSLLGSLDPATAGLPWGPPRPWWRGSPEKQWREGLVPTAPSEQSRQGTCHLSLPWGLWGAIALSWRVFPSFYPLASISEILFFKPTILTFPCPMSTFKTAMRGSPAWSRSMSRLRSALRGRTCSAHPAARPGCAPAWGALGGLRAPRRVRGSASTLPSPALYFSAILNNAAGSQIFSSFKKMFVFSL